MDMSGLGMSYLSLSRVLIVVVRVPRKTDLINYRICILLS